MLDRRDEAATEPLVELDMELEDVEARGDNDDFSSGANRTTGTWNTTTPPTIFGIIPLGNSFSIRSPTTRTGRSSLASRTSISATIRQHGPRRA